MSFNGLRPDRERLEQLFEMVKRDRIRLNLLRQLSDGRYHNTSTLTRNLKTIEKSMGIVRVATILDEFQSLLGENFLQKNQTNEISEWRINPVDIGTIETILKRFGTQEE
ncbi:MAG: hypothetical protein ACTSUV_04900 [Candidatus Ranarchaeia archaeon]